MSSRMQHEDTNCISDSVEYYSVLAHKLWGTGCQAVPVVGIQILNSVHISESACYCHYYIVNSGLVSYDTYIMEQNIWEYARQYTSDDYDRKST